MSGTDDLTQGNYAEPLYMFMLTYVPFNLVRPTQRYIVHNTEEPSSLNLCIHKEGILFLRTNVYCCVYNEQNKMAWTRGNPLSGQSLGEGD